MAKLTREQLIAGTGYTENLYLNDEDYIVIKKLSFDVFQNIYGEYEKTKDENKLNRDLISLSVVEPKLEPQEALSLPVDYVTKIINKILEINGMPTQEEVEQFRKDQ